MRRSHCLIAVAFTCTLSAQWLHYPTAGIPRTKDGKPNLSAPAPKTKDGQPDFSGLWEPDTPLKYYFDVGADIGELPMQPWAAKLYKERLESNGKDDPNGFCLPSGLVEKHAVPAPFRIVQVPGFIAILYESRTIYRQIFTDGRPLPEVQLPTWQGYSVGNFQHDTLVVESTGFTDRLWLDQQGHPVSDALRVIEHFRRPNYGRLEVQITVNDPKAYTKPWTVTETMHLLPDTELMEHICEENNKDPEHMVGK